MSQEEDKSENSEFKTLKPYWNCPLCTFENKAESFKCKMCHVRRGSSSRQSSINPVLATQQYRPTSHQNHKKHHLSKQKDPSSKNKNKQNVKVGRLGKRSKQAHTAKISNIDRKSGRSLAITVNNVTVTFTEYKLKPKKTNNVNKKSKSSVFLPQCLVPSEIDSSSKSSFTSQSESLQSYTDVVSNDKIESNGIDQ